MRKKNSNSSVPSGMHSLAQRSQQERRQKTREGSEREPETLCLQAVELR